jgi:hypothetical protein
MSPEQRILILKAVDVYAQTGAWVPLAKLLAEAKSKKENLSFTGLKNNANRMISAYRFLEVRRPDVLETPEDIFGQFRAFACLPTLWKRLPPGEEREKRIDAILENIINGRIPTYVVERYATTLTDSYVIPTHRKKFEEKLKPPSEKLLNAVKVYRAGGQLHWLDFTKVIIEAKENHEDISTIDFSLPQISRMIAAYRFLEVKRPEILKSPEELKGSITALSLLPHMAGKLAPEVIENYLEKILSGELREDEMKKISVEFDISQPSPTRIESEPVVPLDDNEDLKIAGIFKTTMDTLNSLVTKYGHEALRKNHAQICDDLATQFRCVADPGYKEQWDKRTEGTL